MRQRLTKTFMVKVVLLKKDLKYGAGLDLINYKIKQNLSDNYVFPKTIPRLYMWLLSDPDPVLTLSLETLLPQGLLDLHP